VRAMGGRWMDAGKTFRYFFLTVSRALEGEACVCSDRDTGLTGCNILIRRGTCCWRFWARGPGYP
jgi:hypothetical protein